MPRMNTPSAMPVSPFPAEAVVIPVSDADLEIGFECADPSLQIERWQQETAQLPAQEAH